MRALTAMLLLAALAGGARCQRIVCQVSPDTAYSGEEVIYRVLVRGCEKATCEPPAAPGLSFEPRQSGVVNRSSSTVIINGRRRDRQTADYMFSWAVRAEKSGRYRIPCPPVTLEGSQRSGNAVSLLVEDPRTQNLAFLAFDATPRRLLRGQALNLKVTLDIRHARALRSGDPLQQHDVSRSLFESAVPAPSLFLPWLPAPPQGLTGLDPESWLRSVQARRGGPRGLRLVDGELRDFARGARFVKQYRDIDREDRTGQVASFRRYTFTARLTGEVVGRYRFEPALLRGQLIEEPPGGRPRWRRVYLRTAPLEVVVEEPPAEGRPEFFSGAVGSFDLELEPPTPTRLAVGQAVFVTLVVKGEGYLEGVVIDLAGQLGDAFRVESLHDPVDSLPPGAERPPNFPDRPGHWRQFDFKVRPLSTAVTELPPISFSWFDPRARRYATASTRAVPLSVEEADSGSGVVFAGDGATREDVELVPTAALSANVDDLNLLDDQQPRLVPLVALLGALPLAYAFLAIVVTRRRRLATDPSLHRRRGARAVARERLKRARRLAGEDARGALRASYEACRGYVADIENREQAALTGEDLAAWVHGHVQGRGDLAARVRALCDAVEALDFGGGAGSREQLAEALDCAAAVCELGRDARRRGGVVRTLLVSLAFASCAAAQDRQAFREAQAAFLSGDLEAAARGFESMLEDGYENGYVLFNLGNCYLRQNRLGEAIAAYRRAQRLLPGDANVAVNLEKALSARTRPLSPRVERTLLDYVLFWRSDLPFRTEAMVTMVLACLTFLLAVVRLVAGRPALAPRWLVALLLVAVLLFATSAWLDYRSHQRHDHGVVTAKETVLREGPGPSFEPAFEQPAAEGAEFTVLVRREGWLKVLMGGRFEGWVPRAEVLTW